MVLTRRCRGSGAALITALGIGAALAGCNQSLFDNRGGGGSGGSGGGDAGGDGPVVPASCPDTCLGDAAKDFDGTAAGTTGRWRYLEDQGRAWQAMTIAGSTLRGQVDPTNRFTTCKTQQGAPACAALPGALLVSSGAASSVDPALEFTAPGPSPQVIQLSLRAYLASGADQTIRLYRNSREDLLFSGALTAMNHVDHAVVVDALPGDRFLVAISGAGAASDVALQFYVNATGRPFPSTCQLALPFDAVNGDATRDLCSPLTYTHFAQGPPRMATPMVLGSAPFKEQHAGVAIALGTYLSRDGVPGNNALDWSHDVTVQFWTQPTMLGQLSTDSFLFDDFDPDFCGGVQLSVRAAGGADPHVTLYGCVDPDPARLTADMITPPPAFPVDDAWHFIRVVRSPAGFDLCIDGSYVASLPVKTGAINTSNAPDLGKKFQADTASFLGGFDDVRVFTGALPCR